MGQAFRLNSKVQLKSTRKVKNLAHLPLLFDMNSIIQEYKQGKQKKLFKKLEM